MEKKLFETVDCNVELPKEERFGLSGMCGIYLRESGNYQKILSWGQYNYQEKDWAILTFVSNNKANWMVTHWLREIPAPSSPKVSDEDVERLADEYRDQFDKYSFEDFLTGFKAGYKSATTSGWSDEDMCEFAEWVDGLNHNERCTVWSPDGGMNGLYLLPMKDLLNKFKTRNK